MSSSEPMNPARPAELEIKVPGSIANLGPGFDTLGLAVQLYLRLQVRLTGGTNDLQFEFLNQQARWRKLHRARLPLPGRATRRFVPVDVGPGHQRHTDERRPGQQRRRHRRRAASF